MTDQTGIALLRAILPDALAEDRPLYTPERMRFVLEVAADGTAAGAVTALRPRIADLLGTAAFTLEPLFDDPGEDGTVFLTLSPDGLDRTLPDDAMFAIAADLRQALGLVSCEPDIGARAFADPEEVPATDTEAAVADLFCWVSGAAPADKLWALANTRVPEAWALAPTKGKDVIVAQPDTGIAVHAELADTVIDRTRTLNIVEGGTDPADPLTAQMSNPGHGTATGSVVASGENGHVRGSAPRATLVPIRCTNDVKIFDGAPVARAVDHAVRIGAHVITMSLGGFAFRALRDAIRRAVARDIIVLAAAGNCVGLVVWPAAYADTIAIGGTGPTDRKWKGSSTGRRVAFSAPAEFVWRAERKSAAAPADGVSGGQGTSFATALTAGIAALWLDHHGRAAIVAEARRRGTVVQELFRAAARQTARRPAAFPSGLGAGIVDAGALLRLPLRDISLLQTESATDGSDPSGGVGDALTAVLGPGTLDPGFDWAAHGAEVSALLIADARAGRTPRGPGREARAVRRPSPDLARACDGATDARLAKLALRVRMPTPAIVLPDPAPGGRLPRLLSRLGAGTRPDLAPESAGTLSPEAGRAMLDAAGRARLLAPVRTRLEGAGRPDLLGDLDGIDGALDRLHREGAGARLTDSATFQLEALVSLTERPAVPVVFRQTPEGRTVQTVDAFDPSLGRFGALVAIALPGLEAAPLASVGRIDGAGQHLGTGFVVGPGLVMTNRHVLEEFASPLPREENPTRWQITADATIDFSPAGFDPAHRFRIEGVAFAGAKPISRWPISFDNLDMALLRVEKTNAAGSALPPALRIPTGAGWRTQGADLYVVGYPAPPGFVPRDERGALRRDVIERLREIFGLEYRKKYFSPGRVQGFGHPWVFDHDATTLGGNSGSLTGQLGGTLDAVGLHFAGDWLRANHAHDLAAVRAADATVEALLAGT